MGETRSKTTWDKKMTLYMLEWYNGLEYADAETTLIGIYNSEAERIAAEQRYREAAYEDRWPFTSKDGKFVKWEVEMNKDLL